MSLANVTVSCTLAVTHTNPQAHAHFGNEGILTLTLQTTGNATTWSREMQVNHIVQMNPCLHRP